MTLVEELGKFVYDLKFEDLPAEVVEKAKICFLHAMAVGLAGGTVEFGRIALDTVVKAGEFNHGKSTVLLDGTKATSMGAAFANAALFHSRVQEDTHGTTHCGTVIIPAACAVAEELGDINGKEFVTALVAGYEVAAYVGKEYTAFSTPKGFRATSIYGIFGSAAAVSKLMGLPQEKINNALSYAASFAFGTTEAFVAGTMEWRYEAALASRNGILAALLAQSGAVGAPSAMEGKAGFYRAFTGVEPEAEKITKLLGKKFEILNVDLKPYPVCAFNQGPVRSMLRLVERVNIPASRIEKITIRMNPYEANYPGMANKGPFNSIGSTLMSTPFCLATALVNRNVTLATLQDYNNADVVKLVERTEVIPDESLRPLCCRIEMVDGQGAAYQEILEISPDEYHYSWEQEVELVKKLIPEMLISEDKVVELIAAAKNLDALSSPDGLMKFRY